MKVKAADATYRQVAGRLELRFERWFPHPVEVVWSALTEPDALAEWLAAAGLDLTVGGELMLHWLNTGAGAGSSGGQDGGQDGGAGEPVVLHGVLTELDPPHLLEYETDIHGTLRWELRADGAGCALNLVNTTVVEPEHLARALAGWHTHLDQLEDALAGDPVDWSAWSPTTKAVGSGLCWNDHWQRYTGRGGRTR